MPAQRETKLVRRMVKAIRRAHPDAWVFKVHGSAYQTAGVPDLLVVIEGHLIAMEVKAQAPGESERAARARTTLLQRKQLDLLARAGATTAVVLTVEEVEEIVGER